MKNAKATAISPKAFVVFILLAAIMLAAGCSTSGSEPTQSAGDNTVNTQTTKPSAAPAQESASAAPAETAQADPSQISFQSTRATPEWKQIEGFDTQENSDYYMTEDGQGVLHLFFNSQLKEYHCYQKADGSWSEPRQIVEESFGWSDYWVGTALDGSLCFAWSEHVEVPFGWTQALRISLFKDGQWREDPKGYDFKGAEGINTLSISWFSVAFDTQGEPHFFYLGEGGMEEPSEAGKMPRMVSGLFLDGQQLTQNDIENKESASLVQGIGGLYNEFGVKPADRKAYFYIDSGNTYHLMGCDQTSPVPDNWFPQYSRYLHSYSRDGGKTWEGPFTVFDGEIPINRISIAEDTKGNLMLMAAPGSDETVFIVSAFKPDSLETGTQVGYLGKKQMDDYGQGLEYEEWLEFSSLYFSAMLVDSKDKPHFITRGESSEPFWDVTQISDNAWAFRNIEKPDGDYVEVLAMLPRRNGNFIVLASESGKIGSKMLYYAEIPSVK